MRRYWPYHRQKIANVHFSIEEISRLAALKKASWVSRIMGDILFFQRFDSTTQSLPFVKE